MILNLLTLNLLFLFLCFLQIYFYKFNSNDNCLSDVFTVTAIFFTDAELVRIVHHGSRRIAISGVFSPLNFNLTHLLFVVVQVSH